MDRVKLKELGSSTMDRVTLKELAGLPTWIDPK